MQTQFSPVEILAAHTATARAVVASNPIPSPAECDAQTAAILAQDAAAVNGYDYRNQAWVENGVYVACAHPPAMHCDCFGTRHAGEPVKENADVH
jgi:hypothetical protein